MKNIKTIEVEKYKNSRKYQRIEDGVYKDLKDPDDTNYRMAISYELEDNEDSQYPLEDILDKFYLHVSDFLESEPRTGKEVKLELAGEQEDILKAKVILGKRVFNREYVKDGQTYVELVIE